MTTDRLAPDLGNHPPARGVSSGVSPVVLLVTLVVALAACSPTPPQTRSPSAAIATAVPSSLPPSPTPVALGTLVVQQSRIGGFYIEGAFAYVEVTNESGASVARVEDPDYHLAKELARIELPAGRYVIRSYVRPCAMACPALDGPTDGCELTVDVIAAGSVEVRVERRPGQPCEASVVDS